MSPSKYSLKDLKNLEKLVIETDHFEQPQADWVWPDLPKLRELSLTGMCFSYFNDSIYLGIAFACPNVKKLFIDTNGIPRYNSTFLDIIYCWDLTHLQLPGESNDVENQNQALTVNIIKNCRNLQVSHPSF